MQEESNLIYEKVQKEIDSVVKQLAQQNDGKVAEDVSLAVDNLNKLNEKIQKEYEELKRLSEWKRFTIAFYGETNAGKSTLIEALRLFLKEKTKLESQKQFKALAENSGLTQEAFEKVRKAITESEKAIEEVQQSLYQLSQKYAEPLMHAEVQIEHLQKLLEEIKSKQSFWQRIMSWFSPPKEKGELITAKQALSEIQSEQKKESAEFEGRLKALEQDKQKAEAEEQRLSAEAQKLKQFADGQIIGDGRSDFTRDNTSFDFSHNGQEFSLIDVPGIEGDENIVRKPIEEAVKKAHAVFYVTRTPRPPQTHEGEEGNKKGTLEKMKEHLGAQTEVWTIYNHAVNNPRQLKNPLIGQGEQDGLRALDEKLTKELAEKYCESLVVSARPAYLGLTECVIPGSKEATEQHKFLERFKSKDEILNLSGLAGFVEKLSTNIIGDYRNKIKRSNLNKASKVLETSLRKLSSLNQHFDKERKEVRDEVLDKQTQIKVSLEGFGANLEVQGSKILRTFEKGTRDKIYVRIDSDIDNSDFKDELREILTFQSEHLEKSLRTVIEAEAQNFEKEISGIVERASMHLSNIIKTQNRSIELEDLDFNFDIKIDNGIKLLGLVSSGVGAVTGAVLLASTPIGWTFAFVGGVLAVVGALIAAGKSVVGFFSSSYKQSQQRKEADKAIRNAKYQIDEEMRKIINKITNAMREQIQGVIEELEEPIKQYESITQTLTKAEQELKLVAQNIKL